MNEDLIYHIVPLRKWRTLFKNGRYLSKSLSLETGEPVEIPCCESGNVAALLNRKFSGRKDLLLIVIDSTRIQSPLEIGEGAEGEPASMVIRGSLNGDAILDKIRLQPDEENRFQIEFEIDL
ncbi:MAG: DUF952 domain-containing protein [Balneolaceae bacterium]